MVDVVASNAKLRDRALRAVADATGAGDAEASAALEVSGGDAKVAIVSLLAGLDAAASRARLEESAGDVRSALGR
jgi:N-acetylmuramic acid 6-phosphate etherase